MNRLSTADRVRVVSALVEGNSLRATARMTGVARMTVEKLLRDLGQACAIYHDEHVRDLTCQRIQCDEIWSFCYAKQRNVPTDKVGLFGYGDIWTWTAIDADTKLIASYLVGDRSRRTAYGFMYDLAHRIRNRVQLTTDGHKAYLFAVDTAFEGREIDYAVLDKIYVADNPQGRYSPPKIVTSKAAVIKGNPDPRHVSTSYVERQNLTMRMSMRRFTRLTNGFSKKVSNHADNVALHFMHYNYCRVHETLRVTPAMAAGLINHVWEIEELVGLIDPASSTFVQVSA
jgi:IS1 family transposase